jgi:hypothetical protein
VTKFRLVNNLFVVLNLPPNNFAGISISISNSSMDQLIIENNTFDGIVGYNPDTFDFIGVFIKLSGTGTIPIFSFRNNIVSGSPYKVIFDFESWTPVGGMTFQHTYNDYFPEIPDSPEGNPLVLDSTEKNLDPLYNGSDPEPYILQPSSPARHTGHHFTDSPTLDILNKSRSNPPNMGAFEDLGSAPVINLQPLSAIMHIYQNASFFVGADGTPTVSYEWLFDSTPLVNGGRITGVDTTHLTIASLTIEDAGFYSVRVYNGILPDTTSNDATLTILSDYIGGLIGFSIPDATIINSYWDVETSKQTTSFGGEGKTTLEMQTKFTYVNWDFTNLWRLSDATV